MRIGELKTEQEKRTDDLELKALNQFIGTQQYYKVLGFNVTEGIKYVMENGYSWFVTDFLSVVGFTQKLRKEGFLSIKLKLQDSKGLMVVDDGNGNILYEQRYQYTDAKREIDLYFCNDVLMLNREY